MNRVPPQAWGFVLGLCLPFIIAATLSEHRKPDPVERQLERIAHQKCGPDGTVDWDDNSIEPPPHCNRYGWDGKRYVEPKERRN